MEVGLGPGNTVFDFLNWNFNYEYGSEGQCALYNISCRSVKPLLMAIFHFQPTVAMQFSATVIRCRLSVCLSSVTRVYCGQTVSWIRMPLGTEVGLGPSDIVLDGDPTQLHPPKGAQQPSPIFSAHVYCGQTAA